MTAGTHVEPGGLSNHHKDWEEAHIDALARAVAMRHVPLARILASDPVTLGQAAHDAGARAALATALAWLPVAEAHEAEHGALSLLDRSHQDWLMLCRLRKSAREAMATGCDGSPAPTPVPPDPQQYPSSQG